jgi:hypothetical protein
MFTEEMSPKFDIFLWMLRAFYCSHIKGQLYCPGPLCSKGSKNGHPKTCVQKKGWIAKENVSYRGFNSQCNLVEENLSIPTISCNLFITTHDKKVHKENILVVNRRFLIANCP